MGLFLSVYVVDLKVNWFESKLTSTKDINITFSRTKYKTDWTLWSNYGLKKRMIIKILMLTTIQSIHNQCLCALVLIYRELRIS